MVIRPGNVPDPVYWFHQAFWSSVDWLYPPHCAGCEQLGSHWCNQCIGETDYLQNGICNSCGDMIGGNSQCRNCSNDLPTFTKARSYSTFDGRLRDAIIKLKYDRNVSLGSYLSTHLVAMMQDFDWVVDLVVPIPLSNLRRIERGYNQAEALSRPLAAQLKLHHESAGLVRIRDTETQVGLSKRDRIENVKGAFKANSDVVAGKNILLIDDVITTGATMNAGAKALMNASAQTVYGLSLARAKYT